MNKLTETTFFVFVFLLFKDKGGVWKGTKMPGRMGMKWRILKGLKVK